MRALQERLAGLSPEKRELLLRRLRAKQEPGLEPGSELPALVPDPGHRFDPFPLSDVQENYFIGRSGYFDRGTVGENVHQLFEVTNVAPGFLERLTAAWRRLIARHDMLRAVVYPDGIQQVLADVPPFAVEVVDLRGSATGAVEQAVADLQRELLLKKAPLDRWPLFDVVAQVVDDDRIWLHIRLDAFLIEGRSRKLLMMEMFQLMEEPDSTFADLTLTYRDYVTTWAAFRETERYRRARAHWLSQMDAIPPAPQLPSICELLPTTPTDFGDISRQLLDQEEWRLLQAASARSGLTPSAVLIAAFTEVIAAWSATPAFAIGLIGTDRPPIHPEINEIVGNFNAIFPLAVTNRTGSFVHRTRRLHEQLIANLEHRYFSGFQVVRELGRRRRMGARTVLPILFNSLVEYSHPSWRGARGAVATDVGHIRYAGVEMWIPQTQLETVVSEDRRGGLSCNWHYVANLFPPSMVADMLDAYMSLLKRLVTEPVAWNNESAVLVSPRSLPPVAPDHGCQLPAPGEHGEEAGAMQDEPLHELEQQIARIWESVLEVRPIGRHKNLYELGATSLHALRIINQIERETRLRVPLNILVRAATVAQFAAELQGAPPVERSE